MSILDLGVVIVEHLNYKTNSIESFVQLTRNGHVVGIADVDKYAEFDQYKTNIEPPIKLESNQYTIEEVPENAGD